MGLKIKKNEFTFFSLFLINLFFSIIAFFVLPEKFFYDSKLIVFDPYHEIGFFGSYSFAILFYKYTFLKYLPYPIVALIQYPLLITILYKMGIPYNFHILNAKNCIIYIAFFMLAIFVSMPSKEFITFLVISLIPFVFNIKNKSDEFKIRLALFIIFCFGFYRAYYSLIPLFAVVMYLLSYIKIKKKTLKVVFLGVLTSIILSLGVGFYSGKFITQSTREQLNDFRKNSKDAQSMFISPIEADTWYGETVSIINGFFAVNIPIIEGVKHLLSPQIIVFVIWQLALFYILLVMLSKFIKQPKKNKFQLWALLILFSYYIVQGLFEPDLASAVRHKIGFFPLIYFIFYYNDFRKKIL